ncbi:hypothetical protein NMG60_11012351 [Bertholletia excelsa]
MRRHGTPCNSRTKENYCFQVQEPERALKEFASEWFPRIDARDTDLRSEFNNSKEKKRSLHGTASNSDLLQACHSQKRFRQDGALKAESDVTSAVINLHCKSAASKDISNDENSAKESDHTGSSGKRRRSRWETQLEQEGENCHGSGTSKRRKTRWDTDVSQLKMLGPIQLPDFRKGLDESELDSEIQKFKLRLIEINSILLKELQDNKFEDERLAYFQPVHNNLSRLHKKLVQERQIIISKLIEKSSTFKVPSEYKSPKLFRKLYVPVKEYPTYNFAGLILGPKGNTQKRMEKETGAKILLRGKGSVKTPHKPGNFDDDDLHVYIEADNQICLDSAVAMVEQLLIPVYEGMNIHKRAQVEELAKLNGTHRDGNIRRVGKEKGHKHYICPYHQSSFETIKTCGTCGSFCHPTFNCPLTGSPHPDNSIGGSSRKKSSLISKTKGKFNKIANDANLYVGHLPHAVDENWLRKLFSLFGKVTEARLIKDHNTGYHKGYGFVKFESPFDAAMAMTHVNGNKMDGKKLVVRVAGHSPVGGFSVSSHPPEHFAVEIRHETAWPGPTGSELFEGMANSFPISGFPSMPCSSFSLGHGYYLLEHEDNLPSASRPIGSKPTSSFDLGYYGFANQIPFPYTGML